MLAARERAWALMAADMAGPTLLSAVAKLVTAAALRVVDAGANGKGEGGCEWVEAAVTVEDGDDAGGVCERAAGPGRGGSLGAGIEGTGIAIGAAAGCGGGDIVVV